MSFSNEKKNAQSTVTVVTVVFGERWKFLKQTLDALAYDPKITSIIVVDNNSKDSDALQVYTKQHLNKIVVLRQSENLGFSGAIAKGLLQARKTTADYVLVMDDDCILEEGGVDMFLEAHKYFTHNNVVLIANRVDVPGISKTFYKRSILDQMPDGTVFEVFSIKKILRSLERLISPNANKNPFLPIFPTQAFVTGGSFLPMQAVRDVEPPDASFFIYGEDLDYAWRIKKAGYLSYQCSRPIIRDIDLTFSAEGDHIFGLFQEKTPDYKVYYRMRNSVIISRRHTYQSKAALFLNILFWFSALFTLGAFKHSSWKIYFYRTKLIARAVRDGYKHPDTSRPDYIKIPD